MAREKNATFVNILSIIENAQDNVKEAVDRADEAKSAAEDAGYLLEQIIDLVKLRREYEGSGELENCIDVIQTAVNDINFNINEIKKGQ